MWLVRRKIVTAPLARLLCFPHAGGAAVTYDSWSRHVPPQVELAAIELPGRGSRFSEPLFHDFAALLTEVCADLAPFVDERTVLFGHSLGALLAFELARRSRPRTLVVSGCSAPQVRRYGPLRSRLSDDAFAREIASLGGTPPEVLANAELMELMLPVLRADFSVADSYRYHAGPPLACPILALGGDTDEEVGACDLDAWSELTHAGFRSRVLRGGHFFIRDHHRRIVEWLIHEALA